MFSDSALEALKLKRISVVEDFVDQALIQLKLLLRVNFFAVYPALASLYLNFKNNFSRFMNQEYNYIEVAARDYFVKIFKDDPEIPIFKIKCEKKEFIGIQVSFNFN